VTDRILDITDLGVRIGRRDIVTGVSLQVDREQTVGIVGESGSGKSMTVLAATGLLDAPGAEVRGSSVLAGQQELIGADAKTLRRVHGGRIGFVFQDPGTSLNPLLTVERQITESLEAHRTMTRRTAVTRAQELLEAVGLPDPQQRLHSYPHQLSGGQKQRVMIAIALACDPELLIADEPTTALDVTTQAQIITLVRDLQRDFGTAVVWISHDLGVIGEVADEVAVLHDGRVVEHGSTVDIVNTPTQAYTRELVAARPVLGRRRPAPVDDDRPVLLEVSDLDVRFDVQTPAGKSVVHAVDNVSFTIRRGHTLGLVGESGSGKSTVAAALTGLVTPDGGTIKLDGADVVSARGAARKALCRRISMVFQDPFASLDPRTPVGSAIAEPLVVHKLLSGKDARRRRVGELLDMVGLGDEFARRYPHELSGGQRQRVNIARAIAVEPDLLILDEATAALDVSVQARVLDLLSDLQRDLSLTFLFIGHDLAVIQQMSHDVVVMRSGVVVEYRPANELFAEPRDDYTRALLAAVPPATPARR